MRLFGLLSHLSSLFLLCSSSHVILMDTRSATTDLKWDQLSLRGDTDGWTEESWRGLDEKSNERAYVACSFHVANPGNWVFTPFIPRESANIIYINVLYNTRSCDQYHDPKSCKETFNLFVKQYDRKVNDVDRDTFNRTMATWTPVSVLTKDTTAVISETTQSVTLNPSTKYVRFGFEENGVCVSLLTITVYYVVCDATVTKFTKYPVTVTSSSRDDMVKVTGKCVANAIPAQSEAPTGFCTSAGRWNHLIGECGCKPGYTSDSFNGEDKCVECPVGSYKSERGNASCQKCPANSEASRTGSLHCTCRPGHFRADNESADRPCTQGPNHPARLHVRDVDQSSAILEWDEPSSLGGRREIWYEWECSRGDCSNIVATPADKKLMSRTLRLSGLKPDTEYSFNIFAKNSVSKFTDAPAYRVVDLRTAPLTRYVVSGLRVESEQKDGITLAWLSPAVSKKVKYEVEIESKIGKPVIAVTENTYHTALNMSPGIPYRFRVRVNVDGWGVWSDPLWYELGRGLVQQHQGPETTPLGAVPGWVVLMTMILFVLLLAFLVVLCRRKRHNRKQMSDLDVLDTYKQDTMTPDYSSGNRQFTDAFRSGKLNAPLIPSYGGSSVSQPPPYYGSGGAAATFKPYVDPTAYEDPNQALVEFTFDIDPAAVFITEVIGGGEFGDVCKGGLKRNMVGGGIANSIFDNEIDVVAIKTLKPGSSAKAKADFLLEASIMGQFAHPNVIRLIGVVTRSEPAMIVTEYMSNGSLDHLLRGKDARGEEMGWPRLVDMMRGIASGMKYLTDKGYVHRDLAARNVLVDSELTCKIADFGLSRGVDDSAEQEYTTNGGKIPVRWTSPEAITHRKFTAASDVWSFGVLVWEVCSFGERPYWDWTNQKVISEIMLGYRLPAPMDCPAALHRLMLWCWRLDRHERPTFAQILAILEKYVRNPDLIYVDTAAFTSGRLATSTANINGNAFGHPTGSPGGPMIPNIHPSSLPTLADFLRSLNLSHCTEKLNKEGIFTVTDLARRSHLDMLAMGLISEEFQRIRSALSQLQDSRGIFRAVETTTTLPLRSATIRPSRHDDGFFV
nr:Ephrin receptor and Fibronectin and Tyrosine protein kinase and Sterile alpha motif homology 2 domain containing protein [Haemonchus contortus]